MNIRNKGNRFCTLDKHTLQQVKKLYLGWQISDALKWTTHI